MTYRAVVSSAVVVPARERCRRAMDSTFASGTARNLIQRAPEPATAMAWWVIKPQIPIKTLGLST